MYTASEPKVTVANSIPVGIHSLEQESSTYAMGHMSDHASNPQAAKAPAGPQIEKIESRFGAVKADRAKTILFPVGILGMPDMHHFALTDFPNPKLKQFKLLQSLDDHALSFITLPLEVDNAIIAREDIEAAAADMEIPVAQLGIVLIVSVHRGMTNVQLSVNARAPIFFDTARLAAAQYVFTTSKYQVQHFITGDKETQPADGQ